MTRKHPLDACKNGRVLQIVSLVLLASCAPAVAQVDGAPDTQVAGPVPGDVPKERGTLQVTGQAQLSVPADEVRISFAVETESASAGEATARNAQLMDTVIGALRGTDVRDLHIETFGYALRPEYEVSRETPGARTISGYRVENNIRVTFSDLDATGDILDRAVEAGANRVTNLEFSASDTREARLRALREAVVSAREQAEAIASAMGVRLGMALEVQGGSSAPGPRSPGATMLRAAAEASTPIEAGELMVSASVTISYEILEEGL